ncbi:MAG: hypothetical protein ACO1RA_05555 [Planctomycetaceae bacterium]
MTSRYKTLVTLVSLFVAIYVSLKLGTSLLGEDNPKNTIHVSSLGTSKVIGNLGHPLGTVVRAKGKGLGIVQDRESRYSGAVEIEILEVEGTRLKKPVKFHLWISNRKLRTPDKGDAVDYYLYETGGWTGIVKTPPGVENPTSLYPGHAFRFETDCVVCQDNLDFSPKPKVSSPYSP